jgi:hypothetical protein
MRILQATEIPHATKQSQILICASKYLFVSKLSNEVTFGQTFLSKQLVNLREALFANYKVVYGTRTLKTC